jgi:hypothetical protein
LTARTPKIIRRMSFGCFGELLALWLSDGTHTEDRSP